MLSNIGEQVVNKLAQAKDALTTPIPTDHGKTLTTAHGAPLGEAKNSMTAGPQGPVCMGDYGLYEKMAFFSRERTPPRNVHALGFGAFGNFTVTHDITKYCKAEIFSKIGNSCQTFTRFSGVFTERGEADTVRDLRGWATKFYTTEGNWDMLAVNTPAFNARDMKVGPDAIHAFKRDSRTGEWNSTQTWDFVATHPEALQTQLMIWTDRVGTPKSFRMQHFFPCNTFSMINAQNVRHWVRFHMVSQQGWEGMTRDQAELLAGADPNFLSREMRDAINKGMNPKWKMFIQVMTEQEGYQMPQLAFDPTKVWKHADFPLIEVGILEVNRMPNNYHTTTEVVAFSPGRLIPGVGLSPDKLLQGRVILYDLTQDHRLGPNYLQLPINCPFASKTNNLWTFQGPNPGKDAFDKHVWPHYYPSLFGNMAVPDPSYKEPPMVTNGPADFYPPPMEYTDEDIYLQPREFLQVLETNEMNNLVDNLGYSLAGIDMTVFKAIMAHFGKINATFAQRVGTAVDAYRTSTAGQPGRAMANKIRAELNNPAVVESQAL